MLFIESLSNNTKKMLLDGKGACQLEIWRYGPRRRKYMNCLGETNPEYPDCNIRVEIFQKKAEQKIR
jgi:hypothetical protein